MLRPAKTLSIGIACPPSQVYDFIGNPANLPRWAGGLCKSARPAGDHWLLDTPTGEFKFRFAPSNPFGVLDHFIDTPEGEIYAAMRVITNGNGSELVFTLFQPLPMSDSAFAADMKLVEQDLETLRSILETAP